MRRDPRLYQLAFLTLLLIFGQFARDFGLETGRILAVMGAALVIQGGANWFLSLPRSSLLSAGITGLSLLLLCRANSTGALLLAVGLSLGSKYLLRFRGKHFFNPTNFGIVVMLLCSGRVWVSPAQWGQGTLLFFWLVGLGLVVVRRSRRDDISLAFMLAYVGCLALRVGYLGQPWAVLWHQLSTGSLLIFTFFMISDPRSTPDHRLARVVFATAVALLSYVLRFYLYNANALFLALFFLSPVTPLLDTLWTWRRFEWSGAPLTVEMVRNPNETIPSAFSLASWRNLTGRLGAGFLWFLRRQS